MDFEWTRSETIAVAKQSCAHCHGIGLRSRTTRTGPDHPCNCVLRGIFRLCYGRFRLCLAKEKHMSHVRFEIIGGQERRQVWGRKDEEYVADFCLVSRRILDDFEYNVFRFHFLLAADWKLCCRQLKMDRGAFFHAVYRIEQRLGRAFRELLPYPLFPLNEYFSPIVRKEIAPEPGKVLHMPRDSTRRCALMPPLKRAA
jgi:hypothetical protein